MRPPAWESLAIRHRRAQKDSLGQELLTPLPPSFCEESVERRRVVQSRRRGWRRERVLAVLKRRSKSDSRPLKNPPRAPP